MIDSGDLLAGITWTYRFRPFTTFHFTVALLCVGAIAWSVAHGLQIRGTDREAKFRRAWGWSIVAVQILAVAWWFWPSNFNWQDSLPLHLCRLAAWIAAAAMLAQWRWARSLTYFWGLGLCLQGFVTPLRLDGLKDPDFWIFWLGHLQIVGSAMYDLIVLRFRPTLRDFQVASLASLAYVALVVPLNLALGVDYGYLGRGVYRTRNLIDWLGQWPERAVLLYLVGQCMLTLLWLVWQAPWPGAARRLEGAATTDGETA